MDADQIVTSVYLIGILLTTITVIIVVSYNKKIKDRDIVIDRKSILMWKNILICATPAVAIFLMDMILEFTIGGEGRLFQRLSKPLFIIEIVSWFTMYYLIYLRRVLKHGMYTVESVNTL